MMLLMGLLDDGEIEARLPLFIGLCVVHCAPDVVLLLIIVIRGATCMLSAIWL